MKPSLQHLAGALIALLPVITIPAAPLVIDKAQTAVLDPAQWDTVIPGERYFDATRPLLVRFPALAETVQTRLAAGERIARIELVLEWERQEGARPQRGRSGWGADEQYAADPGEWHVVAHALLKPWSTADGLTGPTFNSYLNGLGFWRQGGAAADNADRHSRVVGPLPLFPKREQEEKAAPARPAASLDALPELTAADILHTPPPTPTARLDFTWALDDPAFGATVGERLRHLAAQGFRVQKHEIRDMKYRQFYAYDWAVSTAAMRIWIKPPRLEITFEPAGAAAPPLPPAEALDSLAARLQNNGPDGAPSVALPADYARRVAAAWEAPPGVPQWQWARVLELKNLGRAAGETEISLGTSFNWNALFSDNPQHNLAAMRSVMLVPPRTWFGHLTSDFAILPSAFPGLLPPGVTDYLKLYWSAWLHPKTRNRDEIGGGYQRGGPSYFRGYTHGGGTMNFGHNAVMGALLGAQLINAPYPLADASQGVINLHAGNFGLSSGAHQEIGDTYYQAITLIAASAVAKYAADPVTRMIGRFHRDRLLEPLVSMYHPGLRRLTHPMGRGPYLYNFLLQEGPYLALHTLSPEGTLIHLDDLKPPAQRHGTPGSWGSIRNLNILGDEAPPDRVAVVSPWCDPELADAMAWLLDHKTFPWSVHALDYSPGCNGGGWHVNFLSRDYALASRDNANYDYGVTSIIAQWRRTAEKVRRLDDLSTMLIGFGTNHDFMPPLKNMGTYGIIQHNNKLIGLKNMPRPEDLAVNQYGHMFAAHISAAIVATGETPDREIWLNDRRLDALSGAQPDFSDDWTKRLRLGANPVTADAAARITISDGVTYVGLIPITINPLSRRHALAISLQRPLLLVNAYLYDIDYTPPRQPQTPGGAPAAPSVGGALQGALDELLADKNNPSSTREETIVSPANFTAMKETPVAGFVIEMGDATQYPTFEAFRRHFLAARLDAAWDSAKRQVMVSYHSGNDTLEMAFDPAGYPVPRRAINGAWPYLPKGVMRASPWAIQGSGGELERHGAILRSMPGRHAYLMAIPQADTFVGFQPLPDLTPWSLTLPDGRAITADGDVGLLRVVVKPQANKIWIDQIYRPDQLKDGAPPHATGLILRGFPTPPAITLNGHPPDKLEQMEDNALRVAFPQ